MKPLVSIGFPVYNAQRYLRVAFESILNQSYKNIEVIVFDNASTDATWEICEEYAATDTRIKCRRNSQNVGMFRNFELVLEPAAGKYFMWMAHDDICEPDYIEKMVLILEENSDAILAASGVKIIDTEGHFLNNLDLREIYADQPWQRARQAFFKYPDTNSYMALYGLYPTQKLKQFTLPQSTWRGQAQGSDSIFMAKIALSGRIIISPEPLKCYRDNKESVSRHELKYESILDYWIRGLEVRFALTKIVILSKLLFSEKINLLAKVALYNLKLICYTLPRFALGSIKLRFLSSGREKTA